MTKKVYLTEDEVKQAKISESFKVAVLSAIDYAKTDEKGYFFEKACKTLKYIIGLDDTLPRAQNGIEYDKLVDNTAPWSDIDTRIVNVILDEDREDDEGYNTIKFFQISSWLSMRLKEVDEEKFFDPVFEIFKERGIATTEFEVLLLIFHGYYGIVQNRAQLDTPNQITSFGRMALKHFDQLWDETLHIKQKVNERDIPYKRSKRETARRLVELFSILEYANPEEFKNRSEEMYKTILKCERGDHFKKLLNPVRKNLKGY